MKKQEQFNDFLVKFGENYLDMLTLFLTNEGCYALSTESGLVLSYRCDRENPYQISLEGTDMYVQYASGDLKDLISLCSDDIDEILFDKNDVFKSYNLSNLKRKILAQDNKYL